MSRYSSITSPASLRALEAISVLLFFLQALRVVISVTFGASHAYRERRLWSMYGQRGGDAVSGITLGERRCPTPPHPEK